MAARDLTRALKNHQNTLKTVDLYANTFNLNEFCRVPRYITDATLELLDTPDFHFLKNLATVKRLKISDYRDCMAEGTRSEEMESVQLCKLSHLELLDDLEEAETYNFKLAVDIFVKCMPNLTVLKCTLSNEIFRVVCQHWRGLRVISERNFEENRQPLDDEGITGIVPGTDSRLPNITLLKYLREFDTRSRLSDKSIYNGFLQLDHLTYLDIPHDALSSAAVSALSSKFGSRIVDACDRRKYKYFTYFHEYRRKYRYTECPDEDYDQFAEHIMQVQMLAKDYGIILSDKCELYGNVD